VAITEWSLRYVADLVHRRTSIRFGADKAYLIEARLLPLARQAGEADLDEYVRRLATDPAEQRRAVDALTINETSWFRDTEPFRVLADVMLPHLLGARAAQRRLRIWSAASSSGQEAYSLAITCHEHLPPDWTVEILATDVSETMVERVRRGRYGQVEMNRGLPATALVRHFTRVGAEWEVGTHLRSVVRPRLLNLAEPLPELGRFDVVFLRNVLIYFDTETRRDVLRRLHRTVAPDGYLLLGAAETATDSGAHWRLERHGRLSVHRPAEPLGPGPAYRGTAHKGPAHKGTATTVTTGG